jgi:hypothetical protein
VDSGYGVIQLRVFVMLTQRGWVASLPLGKTQQAGGDQELVWTLCIRAT